MKNIKGFVAGVFTGCLVLLGSALAFAEEKVTILLPINYFCIEEDQTESTQEQLDEYSKDGLKYEFTDDGQIRLTVEDKEAALKAVVDGMEKEFAEMTDPDSYMYVKSFQKLEYNDDLTDFTITCNKDDWGFMDDFYSAYFIISSRDYQRYSGIEDKDLKCEVKFVDEKGEVISTDNMDNWRDSGEEETETES